MGLFSRREKLLENARPHEDTGERERSSNSIALLLALAAVVAALIGGRAALLGDSGSDQLNLALREDVRQGARIVGDVRRLYEEDASIAHRIAEAELLSGAMSRAANGESGDNAAILEAEAAAQGTLADVLASASNLAKDSPQRAIALDGGDLLQRLTEIRAERSPELAGLDPDATQSDAESRAEASALLSAAVVPVAVAFLLGAVAEVAPRRRRLLIGAGYACVSVGVIAAILIEVAA